VLQSFDEETLKVAKTLVPLVPRVFLVSPQTADRIDSAAKLKEISGWATGVAPNKAIFEKLPDLVKWAHAANLKVTPWTFRAAAVPAGFATVRDEMAYFLYTLGVDELFTDNPDMFPRTK
jgi:glycerophosphoryl diester phosphodiesterase